MKKQITKISLLSCLFFCTTASLAVSQSFTDWYYVWTPPKHCNTSVMQDNAPQREEVGQKTLIYCNPLLLNGQPFDYETFSISSRGILSVVEGAPMSAEATAIPFKVYLKREGKLLENTATGLTQESKYTIEVADVLSHSQPGDLLIIDPIKKAHWKAKRIIKVAGGC